VLTALDGEEEFVDRWSTIPTVVGDSVGVISDGWSGKKRKKLKKNTHGEGFVVGQDRK
jgi:hypothetical protein